AGRASKSSGTNSASPINPRSSGSLWMANTCHPTATAIMFSAKRIEKIAVQRNLKSRIRNAGGRRRRTARRLGSARGREYGGQARPDAGAPRGGAAPGEREGGRAEARAGQAPCARTAREAARSGLLRRAGPVRPAPRGRVRDARETALG